MSIRLTAILLWALAVTPVGAADLSRIDRALTKEPVYRSKKPLYALAVFGPEARHRVWLVLDGDTLYVDRDGSGDLTRPGCRVEAKPGQAALVYSIGTIEEGGREHADFGLAVIPLKGLPDEVREEISASDPAAKKLLADPEARLYSLSANVVVSGFRGTRDGGR